MRKQNIKSIAIVFDGLGFGGIERIGIDYVKMLVELGYSVDVYNLNPDGNDLVNTLPRNVKYITKKYPRELCPEIYSYGIQKWWWGKYAYAVISPILSLKQKVDTLIYKSKTYDVCIAISGHINDLSFISKGFLKSSKRICWCHGNLISYLAICDAYSILYRGIDTIVTLSSAGEKDVYPGRKYLYDKKIVKLYNPTYIKDKHVDRQKIRKLKEKYGNYMIMTARAEYRKGYDIAIKVEKIIKSKGVDIKLLFAGDGEKIEEYKKLAKEEGVDEHCIFLGNVEDIQNYITASSIVLLTSRWEGLPTVIIEAMTLGKPCVMTNTDDGEVSCGGQYCYLEKVDDAEGVADDIIKLCTDEDIYKKYEALSLKRAEDFKPEVIKEQLVSIIEG